MHAIEAAPAAGAMDGVDLAEIALAVQRVREIEHTLADGRVRVQLRYPTRHARQRLIAQHAAAGTGRVDVLEAERALVLMSVLGWSGVVLDDLWPGHKRGAQPVAYTPEAAALLLDEQVEWRSALASALANAWSARDAEVEAARGNSGAASSGSAPSAAADPTAPRWPDSEG